MSAEKPSKPGAIEKPVIPEIEAEAPVPVTPENQEIAMTPDPMQAERRLVADAADLAVVQERLGIPTAGNVQDESFKVDKIKDYEKANGVNQDVIAQSYLARVDIYKGLSEKSTAAMNRYLRLEALIERDSPLIDARDNPSVIEAKKEWMDAVTETERVYKIMNPLLEHLLPETLEKYRKDFELRGAINPNY